MAAVLATADMTIQKNSQILVNVEEALADLLVVSYSTDNKQFQGVLLDSSKSNLPFGVYSLHPAFSKHTGSTGNSNDKLHSVSQRFTYQEPQYASESVQKSKPGPKGKSNQKMTIRLRPRKVLCSNCQGICNEDNKNVGSVKRKLECDDEIPHDTHDVSKVDKKYSIRNTLVPKLSRLNATEINCNVKGAKSNKNAKSEKSDNDEQGPETRELAFVNVSENDCDNDQKEDASFSSMFSSVKTLKICFGEGEGTVVKIPPLGSDYNEDSGVSCDITKPEIKAAKKALKKAKKQAKKYNLDQDPRQTRQINALSSNNVSNIDEEDPLEKKHKHKVKHKKRSKLQKKRDENTTKFTEVEPEGDDVNYFGDIKEHCLKQKLSICLRRLSSDSCEKRNDTSGSEDCEDVPDFPQSAPEGAGGRLICVSPGDIVWGKVMGFPWWPGRVVSVTSSSRAHVAWFNSTTSSMMPCDSLSPFLEDYKIRFNKKKRGPYKEAVEQATIEAKRIESHPQDPLASPEIVTMSPRPINVFS